MDFTVTHDGFVIAQRPSRLRGYWPEALVALIWVTSLARPTWSSLLLAAIFTIGLVLSRRTRVEVDAQGIRWRTADAIRTTALPWPSVDEVVIDWASSQLRLETSGNTVEIAVKLPSQPAYRRHMQAILGQHVAVVRDVPASWTPASPPTPLLPDEQATANREARH